MIDIRVFGDKGIKERVELPKGGMKERAPRWFNHPAHTENMKLITNLLVMRVKWAKRTIENRRQILVENLNVARRK